LWLGLRWPIGRQHLVLRSVGCVLAGAAYAVSEVAVETDVPLCTGDPARIALFPSYRRSVAILLIFGFHVNMISYRVILGIQSSFCYYRRCRVSFGTINRDQQTGVGNVVWDFQRLFRSCGTPSPDWIAHALREATGTLGPSQERKLLNANNLYVKTLTVITGC
jgi:hypothetical protein